MRHKTLTLAGLITLALTTLTMSAFFRKDKTWQPADADGHVLTELWADWRKAVQQDRPKRQADILARIREQAISQHIAWDFYDASERYIDAASSRNWKLRDSLNAEFARNVREFNEPLVTFSWMGGRGNVPVDSIFDYVQANAKSLKASHNAIFYKDGIHHYGSLRDVNAPFLKDFYSNDYEYALWQLLPFTSGNKVGEGRVYEALKAYEGNAYPLGVYLDYLTVKVNTMEDADKQLELQKFADKYNGKAISMLAKADILAYRFAGMKKGKSSSSDYEAFYRECQAFEKTRSAFHGDEARVAEDVESVKNIISELTEKNVDLSVRDGKVIAVLTNMNSVHLEMRLKDNSGKPLIDNVLKNDTGSFFVGDTLSMDIPELSDGEYFIVAKSGKIEGILPYSSHRISLASRTDSRGLCIYATDYKSGEPLKSANIELKKNGKIVTAVKNFSFNGFTALPGEITSRMKGDSYYSLNCSFVDNAGFLHRSPDISVRGENPVGISQASDKQDARQSLCSIYTDRGAYNPGDTVDFKAVIYCTDGISSAEVAPAYAEYKVSLVNAEGKEVNSMSLLTNDFGSIAGRFVLPESGRNGWYSIEISGEGQKEAVFSKSIRVDDFILPTFDVAFDNVDKLYLPGDEIAVSGQVSSYSGHPVSSDNAVYEVASYYGKRIVSGSLPIASDGTFTLKFRSDNSGWSSYRITVRITDGTGETHEYGKSVFVAGSVKVRAGLVNAAEGKVNSLEKIRTVWGDWYNVNIPVILLADTASVKLSVDSQDGRPVPVSISYCIENETRESVSASSVQSGAIESIDMSGLASGLYTLKASVSVKDDAGKEYNDTTTLKFVLVRDSDNVLDAPVKDLIVPLNTEVKAGTQAEMLFGTADGSPVWALAEVFGENSELLETRMVQLSGVRGADGSMTRLSFDYKAEYPDAIRIQIFYFKDSETVSCGYEYHRVRTAFDLPLEFSSFEDRTWPSSSYTFFVRTLPGVECLAAVFDKSTEVIAPNAWDVFRLGDFHVGYVYVDACPGSVGEKDIFSNNSLDEVVTVGYGAQARRYKSNRLHTRAAEAPMMDKAEGEAAEDVPGDAAAEPEIRERFANALTFQPFLRSDKDGNLSFTFSTSDKLSTYIVSLYAHDKMMHNASLCREMMVTLPLKVNVTEPEYLYSSDKYRLAASVSSVADNDISGTLTLYVYNGKDRKTLEASGATPLSVHTEEVTVPAGKSVRAVFDVNVAELLKGIALPSDLGLKVVFNAGGGLGHESGFSDGLFVSVPVYPAEQTLTESHSAVLMAGMDKNQMIDRLRGEFANVSGADAESKEISIIDMIREAIPSKVEPDGRDVLSLTEAMYVRGLSYQLRALARVPADVDVKTSDDELFRKVFSCHNADGGFGWFEGMKSSPVITAVLLERFAKMIAAGNLDGNAAVAEDAASCDDIEAVLASAVRYLDKGQFGLPDVCPLWCGGISDAQYMYVRSLFTSVAFDGKILAGKDMDKRLKNFRKAAKDYLLPKKERGLNGYIIDKARRLSTLRNLAASGDGAVLAKAWGLGLNLDGKLMASVDADVVSLLEYAVDYKDGGIYYPNLVMPFRGLLASEAYAHSMLCDLLTDYALDASSDPAASSSDNVKEALRVADGIRIWLMLQKETQHWDAEPAFVDAVNSVMNGSSAVKSTSVVALMAKSRKPFSDIRAAGNGFTIERHFFIEGSGSEAGGVVRREIKPGEVLHVGDKVLAEYRIHNDENRSFVKVTVPREAAFRPVNQLSGRYGWWLSPLRVSGWYSFAPQGYRDVKPDRTEYLFDSYPEEDTVISEELFVTQSGVFSAPVPVIESLYAPHYRANAAFCGDVTAE